MDVFDGYEVLKNTVSEQMYDVPRGDSTSHLYTKVITYVGRKL